MLRKEICEQIQRRLANGTPSNDFEPSLSEINSWLDGGVAIAAMRNYTDSASLDIEYIADAFYYSYKVPISKDDETGYYKGTLPALPLAIPRGYDISNASVIGSGFVGKSAVRVSPQQLPIFRDLPKPSDAIFFWTEGKLVFLESPFDLVNRSLRVTMAGSKGSAKLTDELLCPLDYISIVVDWVYSKFVQNPPKDVTKDNLNKA